MHIMRIISSIHVYILYRNILIISADNSINENNVPTEVSFTYKHGCSSIGVFTGPYSPSMALGSGTRPITNSWLTLDGVDVFALDDVIVDLWRTLDRDDLLLCHVSIISLILRNKQLIVLLRSIIF